MMFDNLFDAYVLRARLAPALIVLLPIVAAATAWLPSHAAAVRVPFGSVLGFLASALLVQFVRDRGRSVEGEMLEAYGGPPSARQLSYAASELNAPTLDRIHRKLAERYPHLSIPLSADEERRDPTAAASAYASCSDALREITRDTAVHKLVFEENVDYGFRRNLWAMKPFGLASVALALGITSVLLLRTGLTTQSLDVYALVAAIIALAMLAMWLFGIRRDWVWRAAVRYAVTVVRAIERL